MRSISIPIQTASLHYIHTIVILVVDGTYRCPKRGQLIANFFVLFHRLVTDERPEQLWPLAQFDLEIDKLAGRETVVIETES